MSSAPRNQTTTTRVEYPPWLERPMIDNIGIANDYYNQQIAQGYQGYSPQDRISPLNDLQLNAMQLARDSVGGWNPLMQRGTDASGAANALAMQAGGGVNAAYAGPSAMVQSGNLANADLGGYMNPYSDLVTRNALSNLEEQRQIQNASNADAAHRAKAFGGSRHGVVEAQTNAAFGKQAGDIALQSAQANFLNAQNMANADISRNLQAQGMNQSGWNAMNQFNATLAQQAALANQGAGLDAARVLQSGAGLDADLAGRWQALNSNDLNNMLVAGDRLQDQDQLMRDFAYQEWLNQRNFPIDLLNLRFAAVNNTPYQSPTSMTAPINRNRVGSFLGGAAAGAGLPFMMGMGPLGIGLGAIGGGLLGAIG